MTNPSGGAFHGAYAPPGVEWEYVDGNKDHHRIWFRYVPPGMKNRRRVLLGEVRRHRLTGRQTRSWRAFPAAGDVLPPVLDNHYKALDWLKTHWLSEPVDIEVLKPSRYSDAGPERFFEHDPWDDLIAE